MNDDDIDNHDLTANADWRNDPFFSRDPSTKTLDWVSASLGKGSHVMGCTRLTGGVNSAVHRISAVRNGARTFVVLRQYPAGSAALRAALEREIASLGTVARCGMPVPTVLAADVAGVDTGGAPSLLMTWLPGRVHLNPANHRKWISRIAEFAVRLHSVDLPAPLFRPWVDSWITPRGQFRVPVGAQKPEVWAAASAALETPPLEDPPVFLHCDFLPVNLLWSHGEITGITDWNSIHRGSRAVDVGQCRRYLASLYSPDWAEELRLRYETITGTAIHPWWDLYSLMHHGNDVPTSIRRQVAGRRPVDALGMTARVETVVERTLERLG